MEFIIIIIMLALVFDYINGFHDAANSIATIVSTKVLTPFQAVVWAAFFNMVAFFIFKDHAVANTIGKIVQNDFITLPVIFAGLVAAIIWNLITWWYGIPSSSSHTLIGGFAGSAITYAFISNGFVPLKEIVDGPKILKVFAFIFLAPIIGMVISMFYTLIMMNRNTWIKSTVLIFTCVTIWFTFIQFQEKKIDENISKFFKIDKLEHKIEHESNLAQKALYTKLLAKEKANEKIAYSYIKQYESKGSEYVANEILTHTDLTEVKTAMIEDNLKLFFKVEQLKILAKKDSVHQQAATFAIAAIDSLRPITKLHKIYSADEMANIMIAKVAIQPAQLASFKDVINIDFKSVLKNEMDKSNNKIIRYGLIVMLLLIIISFLYTEQIREPSAQLTANNFKKLQLLSSAAFSIGHGGNDAQKVMGIIAAALVANGTIVDIKNMPDWVPLSCYLAISLGTLSGGWKIVKTMGTKITKVTPLEGVCAETAGATTLFLTEQMGIPVSTTHTITGAIIGVGATKRLSAVRWGVTVNLLWAWILTIPISALLAAIIYYMIHFFV